MGFSQRTLTVNERTISENVEVFTLMQRWSVAKYGLLILAQRIYLLRMAK